MPAGRRSVAGGGGGGRIAGQTKRLPSSHAEKRATATKLRKADHRTERERERERERVVSECGNEFLKQLSCLPACGAQMRIQVSALENQAGSDRSVTCGMDRRGGREGGGPPEGGEREEEEARGRARGRAGRDKERGGGKATQAGGGGGAAGAASAPLLLLRRAPNGVPRVRGPFGETQSPPAATPTDSLARRSSSAALSASEECEGGLEMRVRLQREKSARRSRPLHRSARLTACRLRATI